MAAPTLVARMTVDEYFANPDLLESSELVDGEVLVTPPTLRHVWVTRAVFLALHAHVAPRRLGEVFPDQLGYELPGTRDTVRVPDVSFITADRMPVVLPSDRTLTIAPDLVVEVLSSTDTRPVLRKKLAHYLGAGTRLVWLIDTDERGVEVHTPDAAARWVSEDGVLDGGSVLPDLRVPVRDLFAGLAPAASA